jgi:protein-S-isoprenylcysteine O-methyltransferase Ste14
MRIAFPAVGIPIVVFLLYVFVPGVREQPRSVARIFGAVTAGTGYVLVCLARIQLGASFSVRPQAKELVTRGLYSRLRNPMYLCLALMLLGLILVFHVPWLFVILAVLVVSQTFQARREAAVLQQKFGQAYLDYRHRTWF